MTLRPSRRRRLLTDKLHLRRRGSSSDQKLKLETLEQRQLLAVGPQLLGIQPNTGTLLASGAVRNVAPNSLTFNFDDSQVLDANTLDGGIRISRSGGDGIFGNGNDVIVMPGHIDLGDKPSEVIVRFAETLPDDHYQIEIFGFDNPGQGISALRNDLGEAFMPADPNAQQTTINFELDLGAQIVSVVPQPITRGPSGSLSQSRNQIVVYFNNDPLHDSVVTTGDLPTDPTVVDPSYYKLISTFDPGNGVATVTNTDDVEHTPTRITYDPALNRAVLTFIRDLDLLAGSGVYRLRVGTTEVIPAPPVDLSPGADPGDSFATSDFIGTLSGGGLISEEIEPVGSFLDFPGATHEPGHREIAVPGDNHHFIAGDSANDSTTGVTTYRYNFQDIYGVDPNTGEPLHNVITEQQKERAREAFQIYSFYLGIQFLETENQGTTIATGDLRAADPTEVSEPGGIAGLGGPGLVVMDRAEVWDDGVDGNWFEVVVHEIGHALELGHTYDLPAGTQQGSIDAANRPGFGYGILPEPVYPGDHDIVHGRFLHRPDGSDIDIYEFQVNSTGRFTADVIAERLDTSSFLDSALTLYRQNAIGTRERIAWNDDYNSNDARLDLSLQPGRYYIAVSASGNTDFNPEQAGTGIGGRTEGRYELRLDFRPSADDVIVDATGIAFDGDADGVPGGVYNYWFRADAASNTLYVDKSNQPPVGQPQPNGSLNNPFNEIDVAFAEAVARNNDGDSTNDISIVRIVGNGGADGNLDTLTDNLPYLVGSNPFGSGSLADGPSVRAPKDVSIVIDAGAIFKVNESFLSTGSNNVGTDRSGSSLQVLGTPEQSVYFTSYHDESIGLDTNPAVAQTPNPGNWGGLVIRNDVDSAENRFDQERLGAFLNYVNHADIRYGGGRVTIGSVPQSVAPIFVAEARPTLSFNFISRGATAAISADPNSFEETQFLSPQFQVTPFTPTYSRVGPDVHGNRLIANSINGLFVRIATPDGSSLKPLTVTARLDDTDIVHVFAENLEIKGTPGGGISNLTSPSVVLVRLTAQPSIGGLPPGDYDYAITFVDPNGNESAPSERTSLVTTFAPMGSSVRLDNLPAAPVPFVGRRIYRDDGNGFVLVAEIDRSSDTFLDDGTTDGTPLDVATESLARLNAGLVIDPGTIIKFNSSRIDVTNGADLIAEGRDGQPIIFTSIFDDTYGAGGTADTNSDGGATLPTPGNWSGIYAGRSSSLSIDRALFEYGGGTAPLAGDTADSNVIEIHQATARIANTEFRDNADGGGGARTGRTSNEPATVFVRGAQPVIVNNQFRDNGGPVISINANALNHELNNDLGRSIGRAEALTGGLGNHGPLISGNRLSNNEINGMEVRSATLTTQGVWDDADIVHVVRGEIIVPDFHTFGGLRLQSSPDESLVVKLTGNGGFTASGRNLDIEDRIGGSLQIIGQPQSPVVLTSLFDNSIGAGFDIDGFPQTDTANAGANTATPGDWAGITFEQNSHDRNVSVVTEHESPTEGAPGTNAIPDTAQLLGRLAQGEQSSDDVNRLGFEIHGQLNEPTDVDVYSFNATAGTLVWLDIDRTRHSLDTIVELIDDAGQVLARSNDSTSIQDGTESVFTRDTSISAGGLISVAQRTYDYWTTNTGDAGMRVVLPGAPGSAGLFYIRVRSYSPTFDTQVLNGDTAGKYQLQLRLRDIDEVPGSQIKFADIRYATNAVTAVGQPQHSPLLGETRESGGNNNTAGGADQLGNLLSTDRAAISVNANLSGANDVDFFEFDVTFDAVQMDESGWASVTFDIDYADGLGRPDTILSVFDANSNLVFTSRDASISQDVPKPLNGSDTDDLGRGSVGTLDPFIGPAALKAGTYYAVVTSNAVLPTQLDQFFQETAANPNLRLEPVNSIRRIAEDYINVNPADIFYSTADAPQVPVLFDNNSFVPYQLGDVTLFVVDDIGTNSSRLWTFDPFTGAAENIVGTFGSDVGDIAMRPDGSLTAFRVDLEDGTLADADPDFLVIDTGTAAIASSTDNGINTYQEDPTMPGMEEDLDDGLHFNAMTYLDAGTLYGVGDRAGINANGISDLNNILYRFDGNGVVTGTARMGAAVLNGDGTNYVEHGVVDTFAPGGQGGTITGMAFVGTRLFAVSDMGDLFEITGYATPGIQTDFVARITDANTFSVNFAGLTTGPAGINVVGGNGQHENTLIGIDNFGALHAFDINGDPVPTFVDGRSSVFLPLDMNAPMNIKGLAFSTLDSNPWQFSSARDDRTAAANFGHGVNLAPDDSRPDLLEEANGDALYFGNGTNYDFPGGAHGSVVSNAFSLEGYAPADQPVLYFTYFLDTEATVYSPSNPMRDSLRAYVQAESGEWVLVATNNEFQDDNQLDELDFRDVSLLHDTAEWRQARVDLSQFAGMNDLRLRFDFDTAGGLNMGSLFDGNLTNNSGWTTGTELHAVPGVDIRDGETIILGNPLADPFNPGAAQTTFEFESGFTLVAPTGSAINDGDRFTVSSPLGTTFYEFDTLNNGGGSAVQISVDASMSPAEVAQAIAGSIAGITVHLNGARINLEGAVNVTQPVGSLILEGSNFTGNIPIFVHEDMSSEEVAEAIQTAFADFYAGGNTDSVFRDRDMIRIIGHEVVDQGPLGLADSLTGDFFGAFSSGFLRGQDNMHEGAYIDDIIIGFAERGEMATNATADASFTPNPDANVNDNVTGGYQLEIRRSENYGIGLDDPVPDELPFFLLTQSFDTNDRLTQQLSLEATPGYDISPGDSFTLSDGAQELTFEFTDTGTVAQGNVPVPFLSSDDAAAIAARVRDAINSAPVQDLLELVASDATGAVLTNTTSSIVHIYGQASLVSQVGDRLIPYIVDAIGDDNRFRDQGMIVIESSYITDSEEWGIRSLPGTTNQPLVPLAGQFPHAGPSRLLNVPNPRDLAPGITIRNNVIARNANGIDFVGDATGNGAVPLGRIVNNTIVGDGAGFGVRVRDNASPTLLNNIVAAFANGVNVTNNGGEAVVVNGTIFQDNGTNGNTIGTNAIELAPGAPLFRDAASGNYYLEVGSRAIDSAIDSMNDRPSMIQIRSAVGIANSPVKSPDTDITGQLRTDDFDTPNTGIGQNPFKDRGALERADFAGPTVVLINPRDNDADGNDIDPAFGSVLSIADTFANFQIQLLDGGQDGGAGVDAATVTSDALSISEDGRQLEAGVDYTFSYAESNGTIRLTPVAGIWSPGSVYVIDLNNEDRFVVQVPAGDSIADGNQFEITDRNGVTATYEFDSGFTLQVPQTLTLTVPPEGNAPGGVLDNDTFVLSIDTTDVRFEFNTGGGFNAGNVEVPIANGAGPDEIADAIVAAINTQPQLGLSPRHLGGGVVHLGSTAANTANLAGTAIALSGIPEGLVDGDQVTVGDGIREFTFEFNSVGGTSPGTRTIAFSLDDTHEEIADRLAAAIAATSLGLSPTHFGDGFIHVGGEDFHTIDTGMSRLVVASTPGVTPSIHLQVPLEGGGLGGIADSQQFTITGPTGPVVFEFDSDGTSSVPPEQTIGISLASDQDAVATEIVSILTQYATLVGWPIAPVDLGDGLIELGEPFDFSVDTSLTVLDSMGIGGGAVEVDFVPHASFDEPKVAESIRDTINAGAQPGVAARLRAGRELVIEGAQAVTGLTSTFVQSIRDLADNPLQANQASGETRFTILLGDPDLDFGDLPDPSFPTLLPNDGARHAITNGLVLGTGVSGEDDGQPDATASVDDFDDGVVFNDILNANVDTPITVTVSQAGVLDAWLDFNGDGDFDDPGEKIFNSKPLQTGDNDLVIQPASVVAAGTTYARFRISTSGNLTPEGLAPDGEVEDYQVEILPGTPPVAVVDDYTTDEDTPLSIAAPGLFANDTDADGDTITLLTADTVSAFGATVLVNGDGSFSYDHTGLAQFDALPVGSSLSDSFTYIATDGSLDSDQAIVFIEITGLNDPPTAVDDNFTINEDAPLSLGPAGLLANDFDIDLGDTFELVGVAGTGSLTGTSALGVPVIASSDGSFSYDPTSVIAVQALSIGETATDTVTYTIRDAAGTTGTATVTITLIGSNDAPRAVDDSFDVSEDSLLDVPAPGVLGNDSDIDQNGNAPDDTVTVVTNSVTSSLGVVVQIDSDGAFRYDPRSIPSVQGLAVGDSLIDTFSYRISDGTGGSDVATVSITVTGENDPPTANDDSYTVSENFVLSVSTPGAVLNDEDLDNGDSITVTDSDNVSAMGAVVVMQADGSFTYDPTQAVGIQSLPDGASVTDTFSYTIADESGISDTATVSIVVTGTNDRPVANDDSDPSFVTSEDSLLSITAISLLDNDTDTDTGDLLQIAGIGGSGTLIGTSVEGATITANLDGTFDYDPGTSATIQAMNVGDSLTDTFTYTVTDDLGLTDTATVTIIVNGANDAPIANSDSYFVLQDQVLTVDDLIGLLANDFDVDSASLEVILPVSSPGLEGGLDVAPDGSFTYDPRGSAHLQSLPEGTSETYSFTYTISDGDGQTATASVTLTVSGVNNLPNAEDDSGFATDEETQILIAIGTLLGNDTDPDGDALVVSSPNFMGPVSTDLGVPLTINGNDEIVYDPAGHLDSIPQGGIVFDTFTYSVSDGNGTDTATVTIQVTGLNDDPTVPQRALQTTEDAPLTVVAPGLLVGADDPDQGDTLTLAGVQNPSNLGATVSFAANGSVLYNPIASAVLQATPAGDQRTDTFTFTISDGKGGTVSQTATVTILGVNDRPTTQPDAFNATEGTVLAVSAAGVLGNDSDIDIGDTLSAAVANNVTARGATVLMNLDGSFTYDSSTSSDIQSLRSGEQLVDTFTYVASDGNGGNREGTVTITVTGINEHPWQNELIRFDVDNNGFVSNSDALVVVSRLRRSGPGPLPVPVTPPIAPPPFYDVNGDDRVTLSDALEVVSFLTQLLNAKKQGAGEGEGEGESVAEAVEKASSQSIVSSGESLQPVKIAAKDVTVEEVPDTPSIDLFLASSNDDKDSSLAVKRSEGDSLEDALDSIATDIDDAWT